MDAAYSSVERTNVIYAVSLSSMLPIAHSDCFYIRVHVIYYAALLPRRGPHIASHSVCPSVCPSVPLSLPSVTSFRQPLTSRMYFSARTEGRISYGHLGRTDSCSIYMRVLMMSSCLLFAAEWATDFVCWIKLTSLPDQ